MDYHLSALWAFAIIKLVAPDTRHPAQGGGIPSSGLYGRRTHTLLLAPWFQRQGLNQTPRPRAPQLPLVRRYHLPSGNFFTGWRFFPIFVEINEVAMNKNLEEYLPDGNKAQYRFMKYRIHKILLVCCSMTGISSREDGHRSQINQEYLDLNMSNPPSFTRVSSTREALEPLGRGRLVRLHPDDVQRRGAGRILVCQDRQGTPRPDPGRAAHLLLERHLPPFGGEDRQFDYIFGRRMANTDLTANISSLLSRIK